ncbi:MAG: glycosyltransferase family 87 protein [Xanthobacteraceae bacterium]
MSTLDPSVRVDVMSSFEATGPLDTASRLPLFMLRLGVALALVAFLSFCIMWVRWQTAPGFPGVSADFISFWTAGQLALEGHAVDAYRQIPHYLKQLALHHDPFRGYLAFFYPPFFLLPCAALALLGFLPAVCVWVGATCLGYAVALRGILSKCVRQGEHVWVLFLGYPAVMVNAGFGQNGFLSAALFGGAAVWLERRPELAGLCLGCLAYKPQLGIIVPLGLAVAGRWRCFAAAAATVLALTVVTTLAFGADVWPAFFADMAVARQRWMEAPDPAYLRFSITVFGALRLHNASLPIAYAVQALATVGAASMLVRALLLRPPGARSGSAEIAAIAACVPFCSPFMLEYDLVILAVPMAWLLGEALRDGFRRGEGVALVGVYLAPVLFKITVFDNVLKLVVIVGAGLLFALILRRMTEAPTQLSLGAAPSR